MRGADPFELCSRSLSRDLLRISTYLAAPSSSRRQDLCRAQDDILAVLLSVNAALGRSEWWSDGSVTEFGGPADPSTRPGCLRQVRADSSGRRPRAEADTEQ